MKIIPAIDIMEGQVVRLLKGDPNKKKVYSNEPIEVAKKWQNAGADLLHIVDLDATLGRGSNFEKIKEMGKSLSIPIQVAGGLRDEKSIKFALEFSSRVVLGTLAFNDKDLLRKISEEVGFEKIVISVDHIDGIIAINGWQKSTGVKLNDAMIDFLKMGFSEFLLTGVNQDGTMEGPDFDSLRLVCDFAGANVIASGGISSLDDIKQVKKTQAFGVILGKALYENKISVEESKKLA